MRRLSRNRSARRPVRRNGGPDRDRTVLVPVADEDDHGVVRLGVDLVGGAGGEVVVLLADPKPRQTPAGLYTERVEADRRLAGYVATAEAHAGPEVAVEGIRRVGSDPATIVLPAVDHADADTVVVDGGSATAGPIGGSAGAGTVDRVGCDVVVAARAGQLDAVTAILVGVAGGPHSGLAVETARRLAEAHGAEIDLLYVDDGSSDADPGGDVLDAAADRLGDFEAYDTWRLEADDAAEAIVEQSQYYSLTVLGAPQKGRLRRFVFGSTTDSVAREAESPVLAVRSPAAQSGWLERWLAAGT